MCLFFVGILPFRGYPDIINTSTKCSVFRETIQGNERSKQQVIRMPRRIQTLLDKTPAAFGSNCLNTALLFYYENFEIRYVGLDEFTYYLQKDFKEVYDGPFHNPKMHQKLKPGNLITFDDFDHAAVYIGNEELIEKRGYETFSPIHKVSFSSLAQHSSPFVPLITRFTRVRIYTFQGHQRITEDTQNNYKTFDQDLTKAQELIRLIESIIPDTTDLKPPYFLDNPAVDQAIVLHKKLTNWEEEWIKLQDHCGSQCTATLLKFMSLVEVYPKYLKDKKSEILRVMQRN